MFYTQICWAYVGQKIPLLPNENLSSSLHNSFYSSLHMQAEVDLGFSKSGER